jgi:hypothetical protein
MQGDAVAPDKVVTSVEGLEDYWRDTIFRRQPAIFPNLGGQWRCPMSNKLVKSLALFSSAIVTGLAVNCRH